MATSDLATAKPRKRRSEAAIFSGGHDPFEWICFRWGQAVDEKDDKVAVELGLALLPYVKPKLKQVEANLSGNVNVRIRIGGEDHPHDGESSDEEDDEGGDE